MISKITYKRTGPETIEFEKGLRYDYNLQNRLVAIWDFGSDDVPYTANDILLTEYSYNTSGIRTQKIDYETAPAQLTTYLIDPANHTGYAQVLEETVYDNTTPASPVPLTRIQYTIGDDVLSQTTSTYSGGWPTGITKYLLYDGHGSTRQLIDSSQTIGQNYNYDAYGTLLQDGSAESNPGMTPQQNTSLLYAGEMFDTNSQQYYNRARWYNTLNGTFNRVDPYYGSLRDPESLHKYLYCHSNPINNIDPLGEMTLAEVKVSVTYYVNTMYIRVTSAFAAGGTAVGRLWNAIGSQTQAYARQIFNLFPKLRVSYDTHIANRVIDFTLKFNQRIANVEVKYSIPRAVGASLDRLVGQINAMVAYGKGQAVVWTIKEPTLAQYNRLQEALGQAVYNKVEFVHGVEGLYDWIVVYFGF